MSKNFFPTSTQFNNRKRKKKKTLVVDLNRNFNRTPSNYAKTNKSRIKTSPRLVPRVFDRTIHFESIAAATAAAGTEIWPSRVLLLWSKQEQQQQQEPCGIVTTL
jgi:hypothetical protein